ncbi:hypothetical protein SLEP1_g43839 [Rubroshorea leprosula]|uniref:Uncharacterized protein n=1 Tax=Rubroshorea leprosula TaxID=152421 RepID=A0AAV5LFZ5_9ROSI|nr:hypothetical protein SLEP1_g43839 [Rubroshorea leprosula]
MLLSSFVFSSLFSAQKVLKHSPLHPLFSEQDNTIPPKPTSLFIILCLVVTCISCAFPNFCPSLFIFL